MTYYQFSTDGNQPYGSCEIFYLNDDFDSAITAEDLTLEPGWYWQPCFPGCIPDSDPNGPFETEEEAMTDANVYQEEA